MLMFPRFLGGYYVMKLKGNEKYHPKIIKNDKICVTKYL
jgi:hypothetical protein